MKQALNLAGFSEYILRKWLNYHFESETSPGDAKEKDYGGLKFVCTLRENLTEKTKWVTKTTEQNYP